MIQRFLKDNIRLVEQVDKFVDPSGDIPEFPNEGVIHRNSLAASQPLLQHTIAANSEIPDVGRNAADLAGAIVT